MKNKTFSIINIVGLASGLACFILIALYVADELSYDRFNEKASRIYRVNCDMVFGGVFLAAICGPAREPGFADGRVDRACHRRGRGRLEFFGHPT